MTNNIYYDFFTPATPLHTEFSDSILSVTWSFITGKTLNWSISRRPLLIFFKLRIYVVLVTIFKTCVALMAWEFFPLHVMGEDRCDIRRLNYYSQLQMIYFLILIGCLFTKNCEFEFFSAAFWDIKVGVTTAVHQLTYLPFKFPTLANYFFKNFKQWILYRDLNWKMLFKINKVSFKQFWLFKHNHLFLERKLFWILPRDLWLYLLHQSWQVLQKVVEKLQIRRIF